MTSLQIHELLSEELQTFLGGVVCSPTNDVLKDECAYSCDTPLSPSGLYANLETLHSVGAAFLNHPREATTQQVYLRIRKELEISQKKPSHPAKLEASPPTLDFFYTYAVYIHAWCTEIELTSWTCRTVTPQSLEYRGFSPLMADCIVAIISSNARASQLFQTPDQLLQVSQYAGSLQQVANPPNLSDPKDWVCAHCKRAKNVWLHLSDGFIGCGRRIYGLEQSGCATGEEGAAVRHYSENPGERVLAVKLGTLTKTTAEVYSYIEDDMVIDPYLDQHLGHFGIDRKHVEKTEKDFAQLELDYNQNYKWNLAQTDHASPVVKRGAVGLENFGNSCYLNSVVQCLAHVDAVKEGFTASTLSTLYEMEEDVAAIAGNPLYQLWKLIVALNSDEYINQRAEKLREYSPEVQELYTSNTPCVYLSPGLFRRSICQNFEDAATGKQQDAVEFLRHLNETISEKLLQYACELHPLWDSLFKFKIRSVLRAVGSNYVKWATMHDFIWALPVCGQVLDSATSRARENTETPTPGGTEFSTFEECVAEWASASPVKLNTCGDFAYWGQTFRFLTFPNFLLIQLKRFYLSKDWTPCKITWDVHMPKTLDIRAYAATDLEPQDQFWDDDDACARHADLIEAELTENVYPYEVLSEAIKCLSQRCEQVTKETVYRWIERQALTPKTDCSPASQNTGGLYTMAGCLVHFGSSSSTGHYVYYHWEEAESRWICFNDEKVSLIEAPPLQQGYLYLYKSVNAQ